MVLIRADDTAFWHMEALGCLGSWARALLSFLLRVQRWCFLCLCWRSQMSSGIRRQMHAIVSAQRFRVGTVLATGLCTIKLVVGSRWCGSSVLFHIRHALFNGVIWCTCTCRIDKVVIRKGFLPWHCHVLLFNSHGSCSPLHTLHENELLKTRRLCASGVGHWIHSGWQPGRSGTNDKALATGLGKHRSTPWVAGTEGEGQM